MKFKNFFCIFFLCVFSLKAELIELDTISYYPIEGNTLKEIHSSLQLNTPIIYNNNKFFAINNHNIELSYILDINENNNCYIKKFILTRSNDILLPQLKDLFHKDRQLQFSYNKWYEAIYRHELNHTEYTKEEIDKFIYFLESYEEQKDCNIIEKDIKDKSIKINENIDKKNILYDKKTNHGETEGCFFNDYLKLQN